MVNKVLYRTSCLQIVIHLILLNWVIETLFLELNVFITITTRYIYVYKQYFYAYLWIYIRIYFSKNSIIYI